MSRLHVDIWVSLDSIMKHTLHQTFLPLGTRLVQTCENAMKRKGWSRSTLMK